MDKFGSDQQPNAPSVGLPVYTVSVRRLVEFILRTGDLGSTSRIPRRLRAWQGSREHRKIQRSRTGEYEPEVPVNHEVKADGLVLYINGRMDGVWKQEHTTILEEIKTVSKSWSGAADPLHWAQLKIYGFIFCQQQQRDAIDLQLTYVEVETEQLSVFREKWTREGLAEFADRVIAEYLVWIKAQQAWRQLRNESIERLAFPYGNFRKGQRELAAAVYKTVSNQGKLFAEAPTGIGKTMSVLFPTMKALPKRNYERVFYLTAKTVTQGVAESALRDLHQNGLRFRSLTLCAKDKLCIGDGKRCDISCPLLKGYFDRLKPALREALRRDAITTADVEEIAATHRLCPHEFSLDVSEWVDAIICDYNYVFDPRAYLKRHFAEEVASSVFLVDEVHNLVERAREMFSADLNAAELRETRRQLGDDVPKCTGALRKIEKQLAERAGEADPLVLTELPRQLLNAMEGFIEAAEAWFARSEQSVADEALLETYFRVSAFVQTSELFDARYRTIISGGAAAAQVRLFCVDPSLLLRKAFERTTAAVLFSATLSPLEYFRNALGGSGGDMMLQLASPFDRDNFEALIASNIKTNFRSRGSTFDAVCQSIRTFVTARRGNYLVYFPSYAYLNEVAERLAVFAGEFQVLAQQPKMSDAERQQFLSQFNAVPDKTLVGLAVTGGIFGEGIDLVGDRLIGAVIVSVALPQVCLERNLIRSYFDEQGMDGFEYAYIFPGMNRVAQAAGRVIRSESDRGCVLLIDARFMEDRFLNLLPQWWQIRSFDDDRELAIRLKQFWSEGKEAVG